ncbi:MAG: chaperonin GroEL, partial [Anaerolineae bacterium]|nr:chaperonin GroEL [Anaerolineae bacterium]
MPKLLLFEADARAALGRGVEKLTNVIRGTLGPKGGNTIIDRPVGTPIISRDGVSIIEEIELEDLFENMGAQVAREVSMQTNEEVGDGTTTALILANAIIQKGFAVINDQVNPIEVVNGINQAIEVMITALQNSAQPVESDAIIEAVASIAATEPKIGRLVAQAIKTVGPEGIIKVEFGQLGDTTIELDEGASFDRGYLSHHMVTDVERMEAVLENPLILISDLRINTPQQILSLHAKAQDAGRPMLIIAEEISGEAMTALLSKTKAGGPAVVVVHPPEYGKWRKGLIEDIAIITGGRVLTRELGATVDDVTVDDLGTASQIRVTSDNTYVTGGAGDTAQIKGRRDHVRRQIDLTEVMVDRDKLEARLAKLSGGIAIIRAGGITPAERIRREQLIEDAINATRAAMEDGVIPGGGAALVQNAVALDDLIESLS